MRRRSELPGNPDPRRGITMPGERDRPRDRERRIGVHAVRKAGAEPGAAAIDRGVGGIAGLARRAGERRVRDGDGGSDAPVGPAAVDAALADGEGVGAGGARWHAAAAVDLDIDTACAGGGKGGIGRGLGGCGVADRRVGGAKCRVRGPLRSCCIGDPLDVNRGDTVQLADIDRVTIGNAGCDVDKTAFGANFTESSDIGLAAIRAICANCNR